MYEDTPKPTHVNGTFSAEVAGSFGASCMLVDPCATDSDGSLEPLGG